MLKCILLVSLRSLEYREHIWSNWTKIRFHGGGVWGATGAPRGLCKNWNSQYLENYLRWDHNIVVQSSIVLLKESNKSILEHNRPLASPHICWKMMNNPRWLPYLWKESVTLLKILVETWFHLHNHGYWGLGVHCSIDIDESVVK